MKIFSILLVASLLACRSAPKSENYISLGNYALDHEKYEHALGHFYVALNEAATQQEKASAMYGLGRANGYLCNSDEAEQWFLKAISVQETLPNQPDNSIWLSQNYFEIARLYYENKNYNKAVVYFEKAIVHVETLGIEKSDPIGYADVLDDYSESLKRIGNEKKHEAVFKRIKSLKEDNLNITSSYKIKRFNINCD